MTDILTEAESATEPYVGLIDEAVSNPLQNVALKELVGGLASEVRRLRSVKGVDDE